MTYIDGYAYGQHDVLSWLERGNDGDAPFAPIDSAVQSRAWAWCLAHNLAMAGALCASFRLGFDARMRAMLGLPADEDWKPGCQRVAP